MNTEQQMEEISQQELVLIEKIRALPPDKVHEVEDFVDFLKLYNENRQFIKMAAKLSEKSFNDVWDNPEDAAYDRL
jgi:hypothetical protein